MHAGYRNPVLKQLCDQQVRFAPRNKKLEQVDRAERLLNELDPAKTYSYEYLCYRITDYRPDLTIPQTMSGEEARHDVRLFVEDVSDAANMRVEDIGEPVHSVEDLSRMFHVSTKTITRWRELGLVSRRLIFDGGRKRVGFLQSSVDRFLARNIQRVKRGERFSQLTASERTEIIDRARRLAQAGAGQSEVARRVALHMNRSVETIRYTLKQFDIRHPDLAVFPHNTGPLTDEMKRRLYQDYRRGLGVGELVKRYCRTRTSIYRVVNDLRAQRILALPMAYIYHESFDANDAEAQIMAPTPEAEVPAKRLRVPSGLPPYLASLYDVPLLSREQEFHLFRQFNYLKFSASLLREKLAPERANSTLMDRIEQLYEQALRTKNYIVQANLRLVVSIAKRHMNAAEDFFGLVSDGNMSLMRAVEKFDFARGNKFSTYASWAIMRNFARSIPDELKHRDRFRTSLDEAFDVQQEQRPAQGELEAAQHLREEQVQRMLARLDEREQRIIMHRFGLRSSQEPKTLKEVGHELGVTKERIRQIEARALSKLRLVAEEEKIDLPD
jgi:RNA polymerase primary sigma factor/RNA polymerase sigma factor